MEVFLILLGISILSVGGMIFGLYEGIERCDYKQVKMCMYGGILCGILCGFAFGMTFFEYFGSILK